MIIFSYLEISEEEFLLLRSSLSDKLSSGIDAISKHKIQKIINLLDSNYIMEKSHEDNK